MKLENCFIGQIVKRNGNLWTNKSDGRGEIGRIGFIEGLCLNSVKEIILKINFADGGKEAIHPYHVDPLKE